MKKKKSNKRTPSWIKAKDEVKQILSEIIQEALDKINKSRDDLILSLGKCLEDGQSSFKIQKDNHREMMREAAKRQRLALENSWSQCPHIAGCSSLSEAKSDKTSIVWHFYNDKIWRGICANCQRIFQPTDPDYSTWINKDCHNAASTAFTETQSPHEPKAYPRGIRLNQRSCDPVGYNPGLYGVSIYGTDPTDNWPDEKLAKVIDAQKTLNDAKREFKG